jgi:EmrB/QacA subfamily drug resistance transporter
MARRWQVMAVTAASVFLSFLDTTIVNVAFPDMQSSFSGDSLSSLSWVFNAYNIVFAATLVPAGRLGDVVGRRRVFLGGVAVFVLASALCGAAPSAEVLIAARALQGLGAAALLPNSLGLLLPEFPPEERAMATVIWGATGAVASTVGPTLGSLIVSVESWRLVFLVNLPVGAIILVAASRLLVERRDPNPSSTLPDPVGIALLIGAVGLVSLGIVQAPASNWGWGDPRVVGSLASGIALLGAFLIRAGRHHDPVFHLELFRVRSFAASSASGFVLSMGFFALFLTNVQFFTHAWGWGIVHTGVCLAPQAFTVVLTSLGAGRLITRFGARAIVLPGTFLFTLAMALLVLRTGETPSYLLDFFPSQLLAGVGMGLAFSGLGAAALGVSIVVVVLDGLSPADPISTFHTAWTLIGCSGFGAMLLAFALGSDDRRSTVEVKQEASVA